MIYYDNLENLIKEKSNMNLQHHMIFGFWRCILCNGIDLDLGIIYATLGSINNTV